MNKKRTSAFERNTALETLLGRLNTAIADTSLPPADAPPLPPLFVLGTPRSGSTFCMQWLAESGAFSYPSNLVARFWRSPFIGAMCQQMLTDPTYDFRGEFSDIEVKPSASRSELGKTTGLLAPNEFWYFWRAIFPGDGDIGIDLTRATKTQFATFAQKLQEFESVRARPVAMKGMIVNHQVTELAAALPNALFLYLDRDPMAAAWSLLRARERMHGDRETWYSFATPNRDTLADQPPEQQVIGQIETIRADLHRQLSNLPRNRYLTLEYGALCTDPDAAFEKLRHLYAEQGVTLDGANKSRPSTVSDPNIPPDVRQTFSDYTGG